MAGWIKIHRKIKENWVFKDSLYFKAWITILILVNYDDKKTLIGGELIDCKRGQSLFSLQTWAKEFGKNWTIQRVRTFFELLKKDSMIITEGLKYTTRLTVCKYEDYQEQQQTDNILPAFSEQTDNILPASTKEVKKLRTKRSKEESFAAIAATAERKKIFYSSLTPFIEKYTRQTVRDFYDFWSESNRSGLKMKFELEKTWETNLRLATWMRREKIKSQPKQESSTVKVNY